MTRFADTDGFVVCIMRHVGCAVEELIDTVAAESAHDREAVGGRVTLDDFTKLAVLRAGLDHGNRLLQALASGIDKLLAFFVDLTDQVGLIQIAVETTIVAGHVQVDNITLLEHTLVGNAVANDLVDGSAHGFGEVVIIEGGRVRATLDGRFVHNSVNLIRCDTRTNSGSTNIQNLAGNLSRFLFEMLPLLCLLFNTLTLHTLRMPSISCSFRHRIAELARTWRSETGIPIPCVSLG